MAFLKQHVFPLLVLAAIVWLGVFGTPGSAHKLRREAEQRCLENQADRAALRSIILRGRDVGRPGSPGYAYYKSHPGEAKKALERVDQALRDLPPIKC